MTARGPHISKLFSLSGRIAIVTGGAQNLGLDMAEALAEAGADLAITSRNYDKCVAIAHDLVQHTGRRVLPFALDIQDAGQVDEVFARVAAEYGRLDVVVNNAGGARLSEGSGVTVDERSPEDFMYVIGLNIVGTFHCCRAAVRIMKQQGSGSIVNIGSISGMVGRDRWIYGGSEDMVPNMSDYSAAKGGIIAYTRDLAAEVGRYGIRVNCISPGGFERGQPEEFIRRYSCHTMLGRMGRDGTDLKGAVVYLASDASGYVTAQNLAVDGGFTSWS
ncbi:MAG: SDR family oxidoreductase [candidate division WS1 bacterium]|jgi:NAD(P)-dependent dehydrogenase (short-subunit alcohol dehydrogenase family)|nr:SDR family oxidoreductase [candidate division WS1 bacterium]